eukprot:scaffold9612_cov115-Skeletonema_menzelii.AAC.1
MDLPVMLIILLVVNDYVCHHRCCFGSSSQLVRYVDHATSLVIRSSTYLLLPTIDTSHGSLHTYIGRHHKHFDAAVIEALHCPSRYFLLSVVGQKRLTEPDL